MTQLEQPLEAAVGGPEDRAGERGDDDPEPGAGAGPAGRRLGRRDWLTPNEIEAAELTGLPVGDLEEARAAAERLGERGVGRVVMTLCAQGALLHGRGRSALVPAVEVGAVVETTGAGDAFNGGFATGLARGMAPAAAVRFGCAVAGISVTRPVRWCRCRGWTRSRRCGRPAEVMRARKAQARGGREEAERWASGGWSGWKIWEWSAPSPRWSSLVPSGAQAAAEGLLG